VCGQWTLVAKKAYFLFFYFFIFIFLHFNPCSLALESKNSTNPIVDMFRGVGIIYKVYFVDKEPINKLIKEFATTSSKVSSICDPSM
jgi:hypothetical protein